MKRYIQHADLKISHFTATRWEHPVHNHNHFEIIEETEFTFLKFTNVYLDISSLLTGNQHRNAPLLSGDTEADKAERMIRLITEEWKETMSVTNETIFFLIQALLTLIRKDIQIQPAGAPQNTDKISAILNHLHQHIHIPEQVQMEYLADKFGYSRHYMGIFFKQQTGRSLREYINQYRLTLIEHRLQHSGHSIKEISNEMGFTDQSHFNKFFRTHKGINPSAYRDGQTHNRHETKQ